MGGGEDGGRDDGARVIVMPRRELALGERAEHGPADVIEFPALEARDQPTERPPRLAV
jgi:hypothetical protein